jgi:hypothetical protein
MHIQLSLLYDAFILSPILYSPDIIILAMLLAFCPHLYTVSSTLMEIILSTIDCIWYRNLF